LGRRTRPGCHPAGASLLGLSEAITMAAAVRTEAESIDTRSSAMTGDRGGEAAAAAAATEAAAAAVDGGGLCPSSAAAAAVVAAAVLVPKFQLSRRAVAAAATKNGRKEKKRRSRQRRSGKGGGQEREDEAGSEVPATRDGAGASDGTAAGSSNSGSAAKNSKRTRRKVPIPSFGLSAPTEEDGSSSSSNNNSSDDDDESKLKTARRRNGAGGGGKGEGDNGREKSTGRSILDSSSSSSSEDEGRVKNGMRSSLLSSSGADTDDDDDDDLLNFRTGLSSTTNSGSINSSSNANKTATESGAANDENKKSAATAPTASVPVSTTAVAASSSADDRLSEDERKLVAMRTALRDVVENADVHTITVKQVMTALQRGHNGGKPFDGATKSRIKSELTQLLRERVAAGSIPGAAAIMPTAVAAAAVGTASAATSKTTTGARIPDATTATAPPPPPCRQTVVGTANTMKSPAFTTKTKTTTTTTMSKNPTTTGEPAVDVEQPMQPPPPKRRRGRSAAAKPDPKPRTNAKRVFSTATSSTTTRKKTAAVRKRKVRCQLCAKCPCSAAAASASGVTAAEFAAALSQSDTAIERSLVQRLQKLEVVADRYEDQVDTVRRKLKKHRTEMWRKFEEREEKLRNPDGADGGAYFLPDATELDRQWHDHINNASSSSSNFHHRLDKGDVAKAKKAVFSSIRMEPDRVTLRQPTLTQLFPRESNSDDGSSSEEKDDRKLAVCLEKGELEISSSRAEEPPEDNRATTEIAEDVVEEKSDCSPDSRDNNDDDPSQSILRIEVRDGIEEGDRPSRIWRSREGDFTCPWDVLLQSQQEDEWDLDCFLSQDAFPSSPLDPGRESCGRFVNNETVDPAMLSQRARRMAENLVVGIENDLPNVSAIESSCPNWRENIAFALNQRDTDDLAGALERVRESRARLLRTKAALLKVAEQREAALDVFEAALRQSMSRFDSCEQETSHLSDNNSASPTFECRISVPRNLDQVESNLSTQCDEPSP